MEGLGLKGGMEIMSTRVTLTGHFLPLFIQIVKERERDRKT